MPNAISDGDYQVFWPRAALKAGARALAARLESLDGKVILQLWDYAFHGDKVFELLEEGLKRRFPSVRFVHWREIGNILGSDEKEVLERLPTRLRELKVDAVITGMAC